MEEAVIIDCLRTAVGKAPRGSLRNTRPDDIAAAIMSLVNGSSMVTGQILVCDGGMLLGN